MLLPLYTFALGLMYRFMVEAFVLRPTMPRPILGIFYKKNINMICNDYYKGIVGAIKVANTNTPGLIKFKCGTFDKSHEGLDTYFFSCGDPLSGLYARIIQDPDHIMYNTVTCIPIHSIDKKEITAGQTDCIYGTDRKYTHATGDSVQMWAVLPFEKNTVPPQVGKNAVLPAMYVTKYTAADPFKDHEIWKTLPNAYQMSYRFEEGYKDLLISYCGTAPDHSDYTLYTAVFTEPIVY